MIINALLCILLNSTACRDVLSQSSIRIGVATSAYQIEGYSTTGCKGISVWDTFVTNRSRIIDQSDASLASASYVMYPEDISIMRELDIHDYRFSFSWTRIMPNGTDHVLCQEGIDYYHRLIDKLIKNDITPYATIFHWDTPQTLQDMYGGWLDPKIIQDFENYAVFLFREYGHKIKTWFTINEPYTVCSQGYASYTHAPGINEPVYSPYIVGHNMLNAHARVYSRFHELFNDSVDHKIGIILNSEFYYPINGYNQSPVDRMLDFTLNWFAQPIFGDGNYPKSMRHTLGSRLPTFTRSESNKIKGSSDFFGLNHYTSKQVEDSFGTQDATFSNDPHVNTITIPYTKHSDSSWLQMFPTGIFGIINYISSKYRRYWDDGHELFITENGVSAHYMNITNDLFRTSFIMNYMIHAIEAANVTGIPLRRFFVWSLLDNFEWSSGYTEPFGIVHVNMSCPNRTRTIKDSGWFLKSILSSDVII